MHQTIVLADDHFLATEGIKAILSRVGNIEIVGEAANGILAITLIRKLKPDCAVIDLAMPGASGLEVLFETKRWTPQTRVIIVTGNHSPKQFAELKDAGADGIILKNSDPDKIREAILSVLAGRKVFPQEVREIIARSGEDRGLSRRELEVLIGIGKGKSNQAYRGDTGYQPENSRYPPHQPDAKICGEFGGSTGSYCHARGISRRIGNSFPCRLVGRNKCITPPKIGVIT